ncbi:NUDIX domain-containing protein [Cytobacillus purgationiresistens]|uniref:NADH pyrophosphatase NudC (Nudix superfamily) n=1 Tax=Cytobacillus purgationiresistens TaxID=863449 RepID=A0ABU0AKF4_9BACI|nr:NUDIX hydrolase [Cytobacillus purgationiresistens]MDQ0270858.1 NADH pyrophosphatase NudC (nudix superfamily) [Cytobacillus purgationiresistens]
MEQKNERGKVWLAVSGLLISSDQKWLVVKKKYGGLKGMWSLPAGFVNPGETVDEAVVREVKEETGISSTVKGLIGMRTGVIKGDISDNMMIFLLEAEEQNLIVQEDELYDVQFMDPKELIDSADSSVMLRYILEKSDAAPKLGIEGIDPGIQFGYTAYRLFL